MEVLYSEGLASHTGPEPCVCSREAAGEASVGAGVGREIEPRKEQIRSADAVTEAEGKTAGCAIASGPRALRGQRPRHAPKLLVREPGDLRAGQQVRQVRVGKAEEVEAGDERP